MIRLALALIVLVLVAGTGSPHGGSYRGPAGEVPPNMRPGGQPGGQPPAPTPTPDPGGGVPPPGDGGTPTPTPQDGPRRPTPTPRPSGQNPGSPRRVRPTRDPLNWECWWTLNRDRLLGVRRILAERRPTTETGPEGVDWRGAVVRALIEALDEKHVDISTGAAIALGRAGDRRAVEPLLSKLVAPRSDRTLRESAALALGMLATETCRTALTEVLLDENEPDRLRAFAAFGLGLARTSAAVPALATIVRRPEAPREVRAAALISAGAMGEDIVLPLLVDALRGIPPALKDLERACAADGLGRLAHPAGLPPLLKAAMDENRNVRQSAVLALGRIRGENEDDRRAYTALRYLAQKEADRDVRTLATIALGRTGRPEAALLLLQLTDRAKYVGQKGFAILGAALAVADTEPTDALRDRVATSLRTRLEQQQFSLELRGAAAVALGIIRDRASAGVLRNIVRGKGDPATRGHAALALGLIGDREAVPVLRSALNPKGDPRLLREVSLALGLLGDSSSMRDLIDLVRRGRTEWVRSSAAMGIARIGGPMAAQAMIDLLRDRQASGPTRGIAAVALGHVMETSSDSAMTRLVEDLNFLLPLQAVQEFLTIL